GTGGIAPAFFGGIGLPGTLGLADLDGDGRDEILAASPLGGELEAADGAPYPTGGLFLVTLGDDGRPGAEVLLKEQHFLSGEAAGETTAAGFSPSSIGDVNGDGIEDIAVLAPLLDDTSGDSPETNAGAVYGLFGAGGLFSPEGLPLRGALAAEGDFRLVGENAGDGADVIYDSEDEVPTDTSTLPFTSGLARAGDVDGDGIDDFAVGFSSANGGSGTVYVVLGREDGGGGLRALGELGGVSDDPETDGILKLTGAPGDLAGFALDGDVDLNDDGAPELLVGAPSLTGIRSDGQEGGRVYVLSLDALDASNAAPVGQPVVTGGVQVGEVLSVDSAGLSDPDGLGAFAYAWLRDGTPIPDATGPSYTLTPDDVGARIAVEMSWTDGGGTAERVVSAATAPVEGAGIPIVGTPDPDDLVGTLGADTIQGAASDDTLTGGAGDDSLDGGAGRDTAVFSGDRSSYTVTLSAGGIAVEDRRADGTGTDAVTGIERFAFGDGDWRAEKFTGVAGLSEDAFREFVEVYVAYFNRAPDAEGLLFYGTAFAGGTSLAVSAATFLDSEEYGAAYDGLGNADFATAVYDNVLGRIPDRDGFDFWVGLLDDEKVGRDSFILEVLKGAKAEPKAGASQEFIDQQLADREYLAQKTDIGIYYAVTRGMSDVDDAAAAMALFDGTEASVTAAKDAIDSAYADATDPENGAFLLQLVGVVDDPFAGALA
ncbi:MAG: DUF4214 domain-containing protein, partial [Deinococcus-Thermus bacterium]|nr:DUF4214 domain-containing protein [Deinococcota bacterium]